MNHQTFEKWAVIPESLSQEESKAFEAHRKECQRCNQLATNWGIVEKQLNNKPAAIRPKPGFTARFQANLPARKEAEKKRQTRKFLRLLGLSFLLAVILTTVFFYNDNSPQELLSQIFTLGAKILIFVENVKIITNTFAKFAPFQLFIPGIMVAGSAVIGFLILWMTTLWRFSLQGGHQNG